MSSSSSSSKYDELIAQLKSSAITVGVAAAAYGVYTLVTKTNGKNKRRVGGRRSSQVPTYLRERLYSLDKTSVAASDEDEDDIDSDDVQERINEASEHFDVSIGEHRLNDSDVNFHLTHLLDHLKERTQHHLGYPYNLEFKSDGLMPFLKFSINNLGDPFVTSNYGVHARDFEVAVLNFFADLWDAPKDGFWGYITTCGTEGNLLGVLYGREKFAPERNGVLYCSKETHYSVPKAGTMYRMDTELVDTDDTGEMVYSHLEELIKKHPGRPAIVNVNAGTTVKGAYDNVDEVIKVLKKLNIPRENYYVHVDGALNGIFLPFLSGSLEPKRISFKKDIDSISVSGHKMLGCPMPCGVVITRKEHMEGWAKDVEYLNSTDTTITGSRNGQAALAMWVALQRKGKDGLREDVIKCIDNAKYLQELMVQSGVKCTLNKYSTTVVFERPCWEVVKKWQLACTGDIAHVVVMPSVSKGKLRKFHKDYMEARNAGKTAA